MNLPFSRHRSELPGPGSEFDARPLVATHRRDRSARWFAGGALIATVLLFSALEARRQGNEQARDERSVGTTSGAPEAIPDLVIPVLPAQPAPVSPQGWLEPGSQQQRVVSSAVPPRPRVVAHQPAYQPQPNYGGGSYEPPPPPMPAGRAISAPAFDAPPPQASEKAAPGSRRVTASRLEKPSTTVIQGTLINAVLETALDSTRPGQVRAVVTRDVHGFDGTRLLIPRGSRLYGAYEADVAQGQKRVQIRWVRLLRPDGASVALDSPAADPLGRAGIKARVDNHLLQRVGNALLGTAANIGSALVTRNVATSPVIVAVPGATQAVPQMAQPDSGQITPTLTVRQGTRITAFVQHDLDFTSVEEAS